MIRATVMNCSSVLIAFYVFEAVNVGAKTTTMGLGKVNDFGNISAFVHVCQNLLVIVRLEKITITFLYVQSDSRQTPVTRTGQLSAKVKTLNLLACLVLRTSEIRSFGHLVLLMLNKSVAVEDQVISTFYCWL